jgi:hypothetical protein
MVAISRIRSALSGVDGALSGEPNDAKQFPDSLHRLVWLPEQPPAQRHELDVDGPTANSPAVGVLRPLLEFPPQGEAALADAFARVQPAGTVLGTTLGEVDVETIAEWHPFHEVGSQWGVYFSASRLLGYAKALFPREEFSKSLPYVWTYVLHHELFHVAVEHAVSQLECLTSKAVYRRAAEMFVVLHEAVGGHRDPQKFGSTVSVPATRRADAPPAGFA